MLCSELFQDIYFFNFYLLANVSNIFALLKGFEILYEYHVSGQ